MRNTPTVLWRPLVLLLLSLLSIGLTSAESAAASNSVDALLKQVKKPELDTDRAVQVHNVEIDMRPGTLVLGDGVLVPAEAISGHTFELAFIGDARFQIDPQDEIESRQLELFAGGSPLTTVVTHAILVAGNPELTPRLLDSGEDGVQDDSQLREVAKMFKEWAQGAERDGFGAQAAILKTLIGEPGAGAYFAVWCRSPELGDFFYSVDPFRPEQVALGQFVPMDLSGVDVWMRNRIRDFIKRQKWLGRFSDFQLDKLGYWDTWVATSLRSEQGTPTPGTTGFEPENYVLDLTVDPRYELDAWGTARIRLRAVADARRSVDFSLYSGLKIKGVYGSEDQSLQWIRAGDSFSVFLPNPVPKGDHFELRVEYEGDLIAKTIAGRRARDTAFRLLTTLGWYPHTGSLDRATYDVTLRWSDKFDLVAAGRVVDKGKDGGLEWERRALDIPATAFTFEIGHFDIVRDRVGHVDLTFAFATHVDALRPETRRRIVDTVKAALPFFEEKFGPYPLDYLAVVPVRRTFSQGFLSIVTLAEDAMREPGNARRAKSRPEWADEYRDQTIAHELSHQWWGNWVGWESYRDQWLSEALAEYSALMFGASTVESKARFLARNAIDWRDSLLGQAAGGRTVESLGPVVLGHRLASSKDPDAYQAIVYDKGAVVFRMLARILGEEPFAAMLGELSKAVGNRAIDTATFFRAMERMSGFDLQPFARRFVYGTGIPEVYYRYAIDEVPEEGKWIVRGKAFQVSRGQDRYLLRRAPGGHWEVQSQLAPNLDIEKSILVVPFQIILTPPDEVKRGKGEGLQSARGFGGMMVIEGASSEFEFTIPERPERLALDQFAEVLASFRDEDLQPKRFLRYRARRLAVAGDLVAAEEVLREALTTPLYSERGLAWLFPPGKEIDEKEVQKRRAREDARIHTLLARIQIEEGRLDDASQELVEAEALLADPENEAGWNERRILRSRLDLARGDYESAFRRLRTKRQRRRLGAEGYTVLAAAAYETGHEQLADESMEMAERRGADISALRAVRDSGGGA
jgi:hypothetical protein